MADRPTDEPRPQTDTDKAVPHESPPNQPRPSTSTGAATETTSARQGLGAEGEPPKSKTLRTTLIVLGAVIAVVIIVGLFA
ncbi:hypothetical protein [Caenispirillum salinarum]|uniref:hypothetical protein n=1 Tax=Caenispirillum salinarum TaxID=859058 RepID=UPI003850E52F